LFYKGY